MGRWVKCHYAVDQKYSTTHRRVAKNALARNYTLGMRKYIRVHVEVQWRCDMRVASKVASSPVPRRRWARERIWRSKTNALKRAGQHYSGGRLKTYIQSFLDTSTLEDIHNYHHSLWTIYRSLSSHGWRQTKHAEIHWCLARILPRPHCKLKMI